MTDTKLNYDQEGDVLYVSFGKSDHVTGVELADNLLLRLDAGSPPDREPRAVGLTLINFSRMREFHRDAPLNIPIHELRNLPDGLWQAVISVITSPPVSDFLAVGLSFSPQIPPLPKRVAA